MLLRSLHECPLSCMLAGIRKPALQSVRSSFSLRAAVSQVSNAKCILLFENNDRASQYIPRFIACLIAARSRCLSLRPIQTGNAPRWYVMGFVMGFAQSRVETTALEMPQVHNASGMKLVRLQTGLSSVMTARATCWHTLTAAFDLFTSLAHIHVDAAASDVPSCAQTRLNAMPALARGWHWWLRPHLHLTICMVASGLRLHAEAARQMASFVQSCSRHCRSLTLSGSAAMAQPCATCAINQRCDPSAANHRLASQSMPCERHCTSACAHARFLRKQPLRFMPWPSTCACGHTQDSMPVGTFMT